MTIDGYEDVPANDEKALQKAVASQPVSVAIEAGGREFQLYVSVSLSKMFSFKLLGIFKNVIHTYMHCPLWSL